MELQTTFNEIDLEDIDFDKLDILAYIKHILPLCLEFYTKVDQFYQTPWTLMKNDTTFIFGHINRIKQEALKLKISSNENTQEESYIQKESKQKQVSKKNQKKNQSKGKHAKQKQEPKYGRKAAQSAQQISVQASQKQMQQPQKPKTFEDLNAKFGKELEKAFNELKVIVINFKSEDDWKKFVEENNVQISEITYRHGSHESREIFFNFEGQKTKGQLVTHYGHGKDTSEEISRQIRVTRRIQK